jgi:hypothetical protein
MLKADPNLACISQPVQQVHEQLRGKPYTRVHLTLARGNRSNYKVTVLRHAWHEFDQGQNLNRHDYER